jgi:hypothetical protein
VTTEVRAICEFIGRIVSMAMACSRVSEFL